MYDGQFRVPEYSSELSYTPAWGESPTKKSVQSPSSSDHLAEKRVNSVSPMKNTDSRNGHASGDQSWTQVLQLRPAARQLFNVSENRSSPASGATGSSTPNKPRSGRPRGSTFSSQTGIVRAVALSPSNLSPVTPDTWKNWDSKKADEELAEQQRREEAAAPKIDRSQLVFNETYIPTFLNSRGERIANSGAQRRTVGRGVFEFASLDTVVKYGVDGCALKSMEFDKRHDRIISPTELQTNRAKARAASKALIDVTRDMSNLPKRETLLPAFGDEPESFVGSKFVDQHLQNKLEDGSSRRRSKDWCDDDWPAISPSKIFGAVRAQISPRGENVGQFNSARGKPRGRGSFEGADSSRVASFPGGDGIVRGNNYSMRARGLTRGSSRAPAASSGGSGPVQQPQQLVMGDLLGLDDSPVAKTPSPVVGENDDLYSASPPRRRTQRTASAWGADPKTPGRNPPQTMPAPRTPENDPFEERLIDFD